MIAGHTFSLPGGRCSCGRRFSDISGVTRADVGLYGLAHTGALTEFEYDQIQREIARLWGLVQVAASGAAPPNPTED